ncbi:MAG: hypothetical protein RLZZ245_3223 [Verrucomicrobiota bacterium]|jgi:hypothetical protein
MNLGHQSADSRENLPEFPFLPPQLSHPSVKIRPRNNALTFPCIDPIRMPHSHEAMIFQRFESPCSNDKFNSSPLIGLEGLPVNLFIFT